MRGETFYVLKNLTSEIKPASERLTFSSIPHFTQDTLPIACPPAATFHGVAHLLAISLLVTVTQGLAARGSSSEHAAQGCSPSFPSLPVSDVPCSLFFSTRAAPSAGQARTKRLSIFRQRRGSAEDQGWYGSPSVPCATY